MDKMNGPVMGPAESSQMGVCLEGATTGMTCHNLCSLLHIPMLHAHMQQ